MTVGGIRIRRLLESDLVAADELRQSVGFNQTPDDWRLLLALEPTGCFAAEADGLVVGTTTVTGYGDAYAWIGMVLVHPHYRRRGIALRLVTAALGHLERTRPTAVVALDATAAGAPLYRRLGFVPGDTLLRCEGVAPYPSPRHDMRESQADLRVSQADLQAAAALDSAALGVDRAALLAGILERGAGTCVWRNDEPVGFALRRPGAARWHVGPVVAINKSVAHTAIDALLAPIAGRPVELDVFDAQFAARHGLLPARKFVRMSRGGSVPTPDAYCAIAGPEVG